MSASLPTLPAVLPIERSAVSEKLQACDEVKRDVERISTDTPAMSYNPPFIKGSACSKLVHEIILDYKKQYATKFPDRPQQISQARRGGLVFFPGTIPIGTDFMIIDPLIAEGKSTIGDAEVDIKHYYIVLKECDVVVQPGGKLVTLAISDIR
ncbi:uncharacterized protein BDW43DRAFT_233273 [Aspergillus alliaceus]|uniref:uncharacterized protein n=1 Tax=Petromyces alliaceus TaxID=209559 RepID=UPI0012A5231B|nr:uncharacterized protein BDW43DRAFT_233273 [Aspergillus alliaceus]KAB8227931.1 hypothetical protein BDW43DRAFT_233273 [Aspergillus alliaceus]